MNSLLDVGSESDAIAIASYEVLAQSLNKDNIHVLPLMIPELKAEYCIVSLKDCSLVPAASPLQRLFLDVAARKMQANGLVGDGVARRRDA